MTILFGVLFHIESSRILREYENACKIEIDRRASVLQNMIDEKKKIKEAEIEELRKKKQELERLNAEAIRRRSEEQKEEQKEKKIIVFHSMTIPQFVYSFTS